MITCECCGKAILPKDNAVLVSYGYITRNKRFYCRKGVDLFHQKCDKAFRTWDDK